MARVLFIIAPKDYQDNEYGIPRRIIEGAGHEVVVASKGVEFASGMLGGRAAVDMDISQIHADDYDALVIPGGSGANLYFDDSAVHQIVKDFFNSGKLVASICISPSTLANSGVLEGKRATSFPTQKGNLVAHGADFVESNVVEDGNIITGSGPSAAEEFGKKIVGKLS